MTDSKHCKIIKYKIYNPSNSRHFISRFLSENAPSPFLSQLRSKMFLDKRAGQPMNEMKRGGGGKRGKFSSRMKRVTGEELLDAESNIAQAFQILENSFGEIKRPFFYEKPSTFFLLNCRHQPRGAISVQACRGWGVVL